jgi:hypothetical protein
VYWWQTSPAMIALQAAWSSESRDAKSESVLDVETAART